MASMIAAISLLIALVMSASNTIASTPSSQAASSDIATTLQEMQRARYFTFVMLIRMVQHKIPHNTTFLMPNDRLMSTALIPQSQMLDFLSRHSISAPLMFDDLIRFPNGTLVPTHHSSEMITVTNIGHQKLYFNDVELTSPDLCHLEAFRCHGINGVIRPTATRRGKGATCSRYVAPTSAPPETPSAANQSMGTSPLPSPNTGYASIPAQQPAAESPQSSHTSVVQIGMACTTLMTALMFCIF
ncbi:hypothetical protein PR202_gb00181 [Eleusine coracana subsp. coracana]|uniref:FAS1 domain-containing protein n=1 Tax=Eleusine coracana subsp. coracana TaxID=191504 RepID=A0AAV5DSJ6_ELECO|nr:hypothetical protein PR202_gb00181 [Eleusine coracana subsp. coracana]